MKDTELKSNNQNSSSMRYNSVFNQNKFDNHMKITGDNDFQLSNSFNNILSMHIDQPNDG